MARMKKAGYSENYRKHVLENALAVYEKKLRDNENGVRPLNRPTGYQMAERKKEKKNKKKTWYTKGGYVAPIIVPATPGGKLANMLRICPTDDIATCELPEILNQMSTFTWMFLVNF